MKRDVQLSLVEGMERPVGPLPLSVFAGTNAALMEKIAPLYLTGSVLDVTYGEGKWWDRFTPEPFTFHDKFKVDGVDFCDLPEPDRSVDTVCFDPPYVISGGKSSGSLGDVGFQDRYGIGNANLGMTNSAGGNASLHALIRAGLGEACRVARGFVLVKCMEFAQGAGAVECNGRPRLDEIRHVVEVPRDCPVDAGYLIHDVIVHNTGTGPGGHNIYEAKRARRAHSYLLVFKPKFPTKGGDEMTLVQPEGVPTVNRAGVSRDAGTGVGRASGALLTGQTSREGGMPPDDASLIERLPRPTDRHPRSLATPSGSLTPAPVWPPVPAHMAPLSADITDLAGGPS